MTDRCMKMVMDRYSGHRCSRLAKDDGYCRQHHPSAVAARRDKARAKFAAESEKRARLWAARNACLGIGNLEALPDLLKALKMFLAVCHMRTPRANAVKEAFDALNYKAQD